MKAIGLFTGIIGVCLVLAGFGIYFFKTERVDVSANPPIKIRVSYYGDENYWNFGIWAYRELEYLDPTDLIKLNTKYLVIVNILPSSADIPPFKIEHTVSWNQSQLNNENGEILSTSRDTTVYAGTRQKILEKHVSEKQCNSINGAGITTTIYELQLHHDIRYIIPGIFVVVLGAVLFLLPVLNSRKKTENRPPKHN
jgi:hypothetical protein